jgi:hypothetical protein
MFMPQPQYKKLKPLSKSDKAYIAGLIDGEGTITLTRIHRNEHRQLCISISSNELSLLNFVKSVTGIGKVTNKRKSKPHHAQSFCYSVYNRQALGLLKEICADLKSYKRKRADLILETYLEVTPRNGKYNLDILKKKREFERKVMGLKPSG